MYRLLPARLASTIVALVSALPMIACVDDPVAGADGGTAEMDSGTLPDTDAGPTGLPDLTVDGDRAVASARVVWEYFEADDCVIAEGCVAMPGWRRLLRFETFTPNHGTADFTMGAPEEHPELFEYSMCHDHYHYNGYADYRLLNDAGAEIAFGHKQAFCLEDTERVDPTAPMRARYDCSNQGIQRGWGDSYYPALDCQWVDVTDVPAGDYTLRIAINGERTIEELSYDDNIVNVTVNVPDDATLDPLTPCAVEGLDGPRDCGWTASGSFDCTPGATMEIGCGSGCGLGSCGSGDDPILRVCPGETPCTSRMALGYGDDGCGDSYCPLTDFVCPAGGRYTVLTGGYYAGETVTCTPMARVMP